MSKLSNVVQVSQHTHLNCQLFTLFVQNNGFCGAVEAFCYSLVRHAQCLGPESVRKGLKIKLHSSSLRIQDDTLLVHLLEQSVTEPRTIKQNSFSGVINHEAFTQRNPMSVFVERTVVIKVFKFNLNVMERQSVSCTVGHIQGLRKRRIP